MRFPAILAFISLLGLSGCSKKEAEAEVEATAEAGATAPQAEENPQLDQQLNAAVKKVETSEYDEAIAALMRAKASAKTEAELWEFKRMRIETQNMLWEKAQTDPKAKEAYDNLAKLLLGR